MPSLLTNLVTLLGQSRKVFQWPIIILGSKSDDASDPIRTNGSGALKVSVAEKTDTVTPHTLAIGASASSSIPAGAKGFAFISVSGTVTLGGQTLPVGATISSNNTLGSLLAYTTAAASSAFLYYET